MRHYITGLQNQLAQISQPSQQISQPSQQISAAIQEPNHEPSLLDPILLDPNQEPNQPNVIEETLDFDAPLLPQLPGNRTMTTEQIYEMFPKSVYPQSEMRDELLNVGTVGLSF